MRDEATSRRVQFKNGWVKELTFDNRGRCSGVRTTDEVISCSSKVIVAAGAWTEKLLATDKSISGHFDYRSWLPIIPAVSSFVRQLFGGYNTANAKFSSCLVATGVCVVHFALDGEELEQFKRIPIFSYPGHGKFLSSPN